jgi:hypothetical protein
MALNKQVEGYDEKPEGEIEINPNSIFTFKRISHTK